MKKVFTFLMLAFALAASTQAQNTDTDKIARHLKRAEVCIEMNYIDDAIKEYNEIVGIAPNWPNVYMYLGNTYSLKGDDISLGKAIENYKKFMQMTDDRELYYEAQDKLSRIEMMAEIKRKEDENAEDLVGSWRSSIYSEYSGRPYFIIDIAKTSIPNRYQIVLSPKSLMYDNIVNTKAYSEVIDGKLAWSYTFQETYIPNQSEYNIDGAIVNYLFDAGSLASLVGNVMVENARANDVGYTNIMDFDFITDINMKEVPNEYHKEFSDKYLEGSCQMKGEHHQSGRNIVNLDTVRECSFFKGDECYPVFVKIKETGGSYYYGNTKLTDNNAIINYSPYISQNEYASEYKSYKTRFAVSGAFLGFSGGFMLGGLALNALGKMIGDPPFTFGKTFFIINGVVVGTSLIGVIATRSHWNTYLKKCYVIHNKQVDENIKKYGREDQANVSVNVGLTSTGIGVSLNF